MKDRIERAKQFARNHRTTLVFGAGVIAGSAGAYKLLGNTNGTRFLSITTEQLQQMLDAPFGSGGMRWDNKRSTVILVKEMTSTK